MNTFALELFDDEGSCCTFYTVRWEKSELSETDKFLQKFSTNPKFKSYLQELTVFVFKKIAHEVGALEEFFRFENTANALPPSGEFKVGEIFIQFKGFPLRLYCFRLSNKLVVLFNGGEKNSRTTQEGDTSMVFHEANQFAERILKSMKLDKQPSEIHKWLSGNHNFTLRSIAKLEAELGETLLEVPERKPVTEKFENYTKTTYTCPI